MKGPVTSTQLALHCQRADRGTGGCGGVKGGAGVEGGGGEFLTLRLRISPPSAPPPPLALPPTQGS